MHLKPLWDFLFCLFSRDNFLKSDESSSNSLMLYQISYKKKSFTGYMFYYIGITPFMRSRWFCPLCFPFYWCHGFAVALKWEDWASVWAYRLLPFLCMCKNVSTKCSRWYHRCGKVKRCNQLSYQGSTQCDSEFIVSPYWLN